MIFTNKKVIHVCMTRDKGNVPVETKPPSPREARVRSQHHMTWPAWLLSCVWDENLEDESVCTFQNRDAPEPRETDEDGRRRARSDDGDALFAERAALCAHEKS